MMLNALEPYLVASQTNLEPAGSIQCGGGWVVVHCTIEEIAGDENLFVARLGKQGRGSCPH
jgi:hypothetical protein